MYRIENNKTIHVVSTDKDIAELGLINSRVYLVTRVPLKNDEDFNPRVLAVRMWQEDKVVIR